MGYIKNFNGTVVLTSKNPEAFVYFTYDNTIDPSEMWIRPYLQTDISRGVLYVNGLDIQDYDSSLGYMLKLDASNNIAPFHIYSPINYNFDTTNKLKFWIFDSSIVTTAPTYDERLLVKIRPYIIPTDSINTYTVDNTLVDDEASYMILRTNPKLTGNITLNVDTNENMFLDTFHISDILNNKKYRKQQVSANSVLSSDIRRTFASLPLGELYRVGSNDTLNISIPKTKLSDQYPQTYNYGAKLLEDELYSEDNGILAPLWLNSQLPDYFAAFRLPGVYNKETYDGSALTNLVFNYLENSDIIQSWSMKNDAPLGKYLNTHLKDVVKVQAPVFLSLTDPAQIESDPNTWYGIAVDKGVVTGRSETTYFLNQAANNYTDLNSFVTQGFERNNLLCPNLINMNFIFDDNDVSLYTMNRYFGLYLTENVLFKVAYYAENADSSISIISMDGKDSSAFLLSEVFDSSGNISNQYKNRIFVYNDDVQLHRFTNVNQINATSTNEYVNKPHDNIFNTIVDEIKINPFMLFSLNTPLKQGEHLRILNVDASTIWEIYATDASTYDCLRYVTLTENEGNHPKIYRTYFDVNGDISYQIKEISKAFDLFAQYDNAPFGTNGLHGDDWLSIILTEDASWSDNRWYFQRITASTLKDFNDVNSGFDTNSSASDMSFFGRFTPDDSYTFVIAADADYGPIDFEFFGARNFFTIPFIYHNNRYVYSFDSSQNILDKFEEPTLYQGIDNRYRKIENMCAYYDLQWQYIKDPTSTKDKVIVMTNMPIQIINTYWNAYNIYPINISLMGVNQVKDIDFTVNDSNLGAIDEYNYNRDYDVSTYSLQIDVSTLKGLTVQGSFIIKSGTGIKLQGNDSSTYTVGTLMNTFDSSIILSASTSTLLTYANLNGVYDYNVAGGTADVSIGDYYYSRSLLKYGLTVPYVSKWVGLGNDCRNNPMRLFLNGSTNYIPTSSEFTQELTYPSFKYLSSGDRSWQDYIFYDINDVIYDPSTLSHMSIKEAIFKYPHEDYFSKLVYTNYNVDGVKTRSSICYYNPYKNTVDVIFLGLKLSISVESIASSGLDVKNYDRYKFSFISTSSKNKTSNRPIELIINENTQTILMVWYQGNDELNYNMRYSTTLPGKGILDSSEGGFVANSADPQYCFIKTPFVVNTSTIQKTLNNIYGKDATYSSSYSTNYAQFNNNLKLFKSAWETYGNNTITGNVFALDTAKTFETFDQYVNYGYAQDANTYGDYTVNYGYQYATDLNKFGYNTTNYNTLQYLLETSKSYVMYYVIRDNQIISSLDFGSIVNPLSIVINAPRTYLNTTIYNGWYKPKFTNVLEFNSNEDSELINSTKKDFTLSNTNLRASNDIQQLWYNKVNTTVTNVDVSNGNAITFYPNYNVFKSMWDNNYYTRDNVPVAGYESSKELSSFFGSKLPKLPNSITIEKWNGTNATHTSSNTSLLISYNITRAILAYFTSNSTFLSNWSGFSNSNTAITNYVKTTILEYYNISQPKIEVNYFYKSFDGTLLHLINDGGFINDNKQNVNAQLAFVNNEYIYNIEIPKIGNFSYYVSLTLTEK